MEPPTEPASWRHLLEEGRASFNRGRYFQAHELWEEAWRQLAGNDRRAVQGLIQIAAGLHHLVEGRPRPAATLLDRGLAKLLPDPRPYPHPPSHPAPEALAGWRLDGLVSAADRLRTELAASVPGPWQPLPEL